MAGIYHQYTYFLAIDVKRIDNITYCCVFVYLSWLNLESIIPEVGEKFNCYLHVKCFLTPVNGTLFSTPLRGAIFSTPLRGRKKQKIISKILKIPERVNLLIGKIEDNIMRW